MSAATRRGLPRTAGGEPWPPVTSASRDTVGRAHDRVDEVATSGAVSVVERSSTSLSAAGVPYALRRGLPRADSGEPWPPAGAAAAEPFNTADTSALAAAPASGVSSPAPENRGPVPVWFPEMSSGSLEGMVQLRRGLPRTAGGGQWPHADSVTAAPATAERGPVEAHTSAREAPLTVRAPQPQPARASVPSQPVPASDSAGFAAAPQDSPTRSALDISTFRAADAPSTAEALGGPRAWNTRTAPLLLAALAVVGIGAILLVRWLMTLDGVRGFLEAYPGEYELPEGAPVGVPVWLGWQHFFNIFFMLLIVRTGLQIRSERRPPAHWTPRRPKGAPKISLTVWLHQALDVLWLINGIVFMVLLFGTGQWMRIVPTSWEVFPNALSAALQYVSLDWPTENGWVNYNGLQQLTYFTTVFVAAPLAVATGVRMSHVWPRNSDRLSGIYPIEVARAIHFPVMLYFCAFTVVHVALVLATGALRNLNHMYGGQDAENWTGFWIFLVSLLVIAGGLFAARPLIVSSIASLFGKVGR